MTDEKLTEIFLKISTELGSLNANMRSVLEKLTQHETRITELEQAKEKNPKEEYRAEIIQLLVKAVIISICTVASLAGAGSLIGKIFGL